MVNKLFIYYPIYLEGPIASRKHINLQNNTYSHYPDIIIELHDRLGYIDLGDSCVVRAAVTNTDLESSPWSGLIRIVNPHRGQICLSPVSNDFTMTGINTVSVECITPTTSFSFQFTIYIQSLSKHLAEVIRSGGGGSPDMDASSVHYDNSYSGLQSDNVQDAIDELKSMQKDFITKEHTVWLYANNWANGIYTIHDSDILSNSDVYITIPSDVTQEQYDAIAYANLIPGGQGVGYVILSALKDVPTIDVPVTLVIKTFA